MQIPSTPGRSNMPGSLPGVRIGSQVNADDMGARVGRQVQQFGQAVQGFGEMQERWAIRKYNEKAEADARAAFISGHEQIEKMKEEIYARSGADAYTAERDLDEYAKKVWGEQSQALSTPLARDLLSKRHDQYDSQNRIRTNQWANRKHQEYRLQTLDASNEMLMRDVAKEPGTLALKMEEALQNVAMKHTGAPQVMIENEKQKLANAMTMAAVESLASGEDGYKQALALLADKDVTKHLPAKTIKTLTEKYRKLQQGRDDDRLDDQAANELMDLVDKNGGQMTASMYRSMIDKYGRKRADTARLTANNYMALKDKEDAKANLAQEEQRWAEFEKTGRIPEGTPRKQKDAMLKMQVQAAKGQKGLDESWGIYLELNNLSDEDLLKLGRDVEKWGEIAAALHPNGKASDAWNLISKRLYGLIDNGAKQKAEAKAGSSKTGGLVKNTGQERDLQTWYEAATGNKHTGAKATDYSVYRQAWQEAALRYVEENNLPSTDYIPKDVARAISDSCLDIYTKEGYIWNTNKPYYQFTTNERSQGTPGWTVNATQAHRATPSETTQAQADGTAAQNIRGAQVTSNGDGSFTVTQTQTPEQQQEQREAEQLAEELGRIPNDAQMVDMIRNNPQADIQKINGRFEVTLPSGDVYSYDEQGREVYYYGYAKRGDYEAVKR